VLKIFINHLYNSVANSSDFTAMNGKMISESVIERYLEGIGYGLS